MLYKGLHELCPRTQNAAAPQGSQLHCGTRYSFCSESTAHTKSVGFLNLGQTCYINAGVQCLYHTTPIRTQVQDSQPGGSVMGDRLRALFRARSDPSSSCSDVLARLIDFVMAVLEQSPGFPPGELQDAAECLLHILQHTHLGNLQYLVLRAPAHSSTSSTTAPLTLRGCHLGKGTLCRTDKEKHLIDHGGLP